jgi:hypothetical protein
MDDLAHRRRKLRAGGYSPLPVEGKRPPMNGWDEKTTANDDEINLWSKLYPYATNTGALTKYVPTCDIDISDPDAAKAVEDLVRSRNEEFGTILTRFGNSPRRAIPFQTDQPFKKLVAKVTGPNGTEEKIEFLCDGQQVVVHGIHPDTKRPYDWFAVDRHSRFRVRSCRILANPTHVICSPTASTCWSRNTVTPLHPTVPPREGRRMALASPMAAPAAQRIGVTCTRKFAPDANYMTIRPVWRRS